MLPMPVGALSDERGPLAMTYSSDGELLHFGEVECDRVRQSLQRVLGKGYPEKRQAALGMALGVVMAHEMYHVMANAKSHTGQGITTQSLGRGDAGRRAFHSRHGAKGGAARPVFSFKEPRA